MSTLYDCGECPDCDAAFGKPRPELLPCPFCGGEAQRYDIEGDITDENAGGSGIKCRSCHATTALHFDRKENLVSSWNDRAASNQ